MMITTENRTSMKQNFKIVFMGTPDFAVPVLQMLIDEKYDVAAVFTQPDRKAGRGHKELPPPVKVLAQQYGVPVFQFEKVSKPEGAAALRELRPDLMVTAAYGHILSEEILAIPQYGCINVHASLLPKLRGAAPIQWAIINGEKKTGVTTMYTVRALDAGDILEQEETDISDDMTAGELYHVLSGMGAQVLKRTLEKLADGSLVRVPQNEADATYFPMFKKGFGEIDFCCPSAEIVNFIRGTNPVPGAYMRYGEEKIKVFFAAAVEYHGAERCGTVIFADDKQGLGIKTKDGLVLIKEMQRQGGKRMSTKDSLRGKKIEAGYVFLKKEEEDH
ncbi:MAG: methionyl-tRNA formyltransferase [Christensenella sp.]|uniref:methionyl-tRNA formyltransferase n=1 Tax=Christensenella sp. TaxID=1935934 RepID=UPI002B21E126|nr:methionyl-tRNA formyltransferase [Christensenella sp.]MEA5002453.1 methionyl-tRNA formyltransferase [Christensenella sp.]